MSPEQRLRGNHLEEEFGGETERYMEKDGGEGVKPVWLEELGKAAQVARKREK